MQLSAPNDGSDWVTRIAVTNWPKFSIQLSPFYCSSLLERIDWPASVLHGTRAATKR